MARLAFEQPDIRQNKPWWTIETPHYQLFFDTAAKAKIDREQFAKDVERRLGQIASLLGLKRDQRTHYYWNGDRCTYFIHDPKVCKWGNVGRGGIDVWAGGNEAFYKHEEAHAVCARAIGALPSLFNEGFAMYAQAARSSQNHRLALAGIEEGVVPRMTQIVCSADFWNAWRVYRPFMYCMAGSFVAYLFEHWGHRRFIEFGKLVSDHDNRQTVCRQFLRAYRVRLYDMDRRWRSHLLCKRQYLALRQQKVGGGNYERQWVEQSVQRIHEKLAVP